MLSRLSLSKLGPKQRKTEVTTITIMINILMIKFMSKLTKINNMGELNCFILGKCQ